MRTIWAVLATALCLVAVRPSPATATRCLEEAGDAAQIGDMRSAIDAVCLCFKYDDTPQKSHANYTKCAKDVIKTRAGVGLLRPQCKSAVAKYYAASICGYPSAEIGYEKEPRVPCMSASASRVRCSIQPLTKCLSGAPDFCAPQTICPRFVCFGSTTCIDAFDTNGNLALDAADPAADTPFLFGCTSGHGYVDNGDGTITDVHSGLMWEKKDHAGGLHDVAYGYIFGEDAAVTNSALHWLGEVNLENGTGFAGHNDWRLPTIAELQTLVESSSTFVTGRGRVKPPFQNVGDVPNCTVLTCSLNSNNDYGSRTTSAAAVWIFSAENGPRRGSYYQDAYVRAVRGGQ